jgi:hypothetical protein
MTPPKRLLLAGGHAGGPAKPDPRRPLDRLGVLAMTALLGGCAIQPWVKPYERERLADPIMASRATRCPSGTATTCATCAKARAAPPACKEAAVVATDLLRRLLTLLGGVLGGLFAAGGARALDLPADRAEAMFHSYNGGGVTANGPALLVRKSIADRCRCRPRTTSTRSATRRSTSSRPRARTRNAATNTPSAPTTSTAIRRSRFGLSSSKEPDYTANRYSLDISQETFGGMTTVSLGFTRGSDQVGKHDAPEFADTATHWQYRVGVTQILTPRWIASANFEAISDDGYLGSPYRIARVFGAAVPERNPRTRSSRAMNFRVNGDLGSRDAVHLQYRYFWDTWAIKAHTVELGYSRYFGDKWLADCVAALLPPGPALFYSDNAQSETTYVSRNRQLSTFDSVGLGAKVAYTWRKVPGRYEVKLNGGYEYVRYKYSDFTDIRTGTPYGFNAGVLQLLCRPPSDGRGP